MLIPNVKESNKWLQEYSGFNLQEIQELLIAHVSSKASAFENSVLSRGMSLPEEDTTSINSMLAKLEQFSEPLE